MREEICEMLINALITRIQCTHNGVIGEETAEVPTTTIPMTRPLALTGLLA